MKKEKGITLIALIITIIIMLILVTISITLSINGGLFEKAGEAAKNQSSKQAEENELSESATSYIEQKTAGALAVGIPDTISSSTTTFPYLPNGCTYLEGDLTTGIVMKDWRGNEWVWVQVPKTSDVYTTAGLNITEFTTAELNKIHTDLKAYTATYTSSYYEDKWYDKHNATWNGVSEYAYIGVSGGVNTNEDQNKVIDFESWPGYYGATNVYTSTSKDVNGVMTQVNFDTDTYSTSNFYFVKVNDNFKNHADGCGLTYTDYSETYDTMLESVYKNGGFWIGRYETGASGNNSSTLEIKKGSYVYNEIMTYEAQNLVQQLNPDATYKCNIMFGVQWDLIMKHIETKEVEGGLTLSAAQALLKTDSSSWANAYTSEFTITEGSYYAYTGEWIEVEGTFTKQASTGVILSAGATERNKKMNIYDLAGNLEEWTLEHYNNNAICFTISRGGNTGGSIGQNTSIPAYFHYYFYVGDRRIVMVGMRASIY